MWDLYASLCLVGVRIEWTVEDMCAVCEDRFDATPYTKMLPFFSCSSDFSTFCASYLRYINFCFKVEPSFDLLSDLSDASSVSTEKSL